MDNMDNLFIAGIKGLSAGFTLGVLVAIIALLIFIYKKFILPKFNKTKDIASAISNHGTKAIKDYVDKHGELFHLRIRIIYFCEFICFVGSVDLIM